jgi:hypothetical protein
MHQTSDIQIYEQTLAGWKEEADAAAVVVRDFQ